MSVAKHTWNKQTVVEKLSLVRQGYFLERIQQNPNLNLISKVYIFIPGVKALKCVQVAEKTVI